MNAEAFSLIFLKNIWASREKRKLPLLSHLVLCAIGQGINRRCDIIEECGLNESSFYSVIYPMVRHGLIMKIDNRSSRTSSYELTVSGKSLYKRLFMCKKDEPAKVKG